MRAGDPRLAATCPECGQPRPRTGTTVVNGRPAAIYVRPCGHPCVRGRDGAFANARADPNAKPGFWDSVGTDPEMGCILGLITGALVLAGVPILFVGSWVWARRPLTRWTLILAGAVASAAIVWLLVRTPAATRTIPDPNR